MNEFKGIAQFHKDLNPKLWWKEKWHEKVTYKLNNRVAFKLKRIADAFIDFMKINRRAIKDIVITGSMVSYNYTPYSDIDLHIIVDKNLIHKDCPIVTEFLKTKKSEFNNNHDIFIYNIPVEVYAEDFREKNIHNGLYSLKFNKWIDEPKPLKPLDNDSAVEAKYKEIFKASKEVADKEEARELIDKIKRMRKAGLADKGEFSTENLVFKKLRNSGVIGRLMKIERQGIDKELSLESFNTLCDNIKILTESLIKH